MNNCNYDLRKKLALSFFSGSYEPFIDLTPIQKEIMKNGDGNAFNEYKRLDASSGLAVNYYKLLEKQFGISDMIFENKVAVPLNKSKKSSNLDVTYSLDGVSYFIESKFLEPYYCMVEPNSSSYLDEERYPEEVPNNQVKLWIKLFEDANNASNFVYFDFPQLCRHLLAIYRYSKNNKLSKMILRSMIWEMPDSLLNHYSGETKIEIEFRRNRIREESQNCIERINAFLQDIGWDAISFQVKKYNDEIVYIKNSEFYSQFCERFNLPEI